jgi:molybdenum cofactor guanylyltransferase
LQLVGGDRIIDRVARALRPSSDRLLIVSNDPSARTWIADAEIAGDMLAGRASLIGIHAALAHARSNVVVVAWDMPFVPAALLTELRDRLKRGASAVIPTGPNGPEAACAAYSIDALPHIERLAKGGALKLAALVDDLPGVEQLSLDQAATFGDPSVIFMNVNRPDDLTRAEGIARAL